MPINYEEFHKRKLEKKWKSLQERGLTPPKSAEENRKRAREAHGH